MICVETSYKFEKKDHLLFNPTDIDSLEVVLKQSLRVIKKEGIWASEGSKDGAIQILEWQLKLINDTRHQKFEFVELTVPKPK